MNTVAVSSRQVRVACTGSRRRQATTGGTAGRTGIWRVVAGVEPDVETEAQTTTVWDRIMAMGLSEERARRHLADGRVLVDGQVVTDPEYLGTMPARIVFGQL